MASTSDSTTDARGTIHSSLPHGVDTRDTTNPSVQRVQPPVEQEYKYIHLLNSEQYDELARGLADPSITMNLGGQRAWTRERLLELRTYSARDCALDIGERNYFYWAIIARDNGIAHDNGLRDRVCGIIGFHPMVKEVGAAGDIQIMYALFANERGKGRAKRAIRDIMEKYRAIVAQHRTIWALIREDNKDSQYALARSEMFMRYSVSPSVRVKRAMCNVYRAK